MNYGLEEPMEVQLSEMGSDEDLVNKSLNEME